MQAVSLDIKWAYHNSPITPHHKPYLTVLWNGYIYIGPVEGFATVGGIQGCLADTLLDILHHHRIEHVFKLVDDVVIFCTPSTSNNLPLDANFALLLTCHQSFTWPTLSAFCSTPLIGKGKTSHFLSNTWVSIGIWNIAECLYLRRNSSSSCLSWIHFYLQPDLCLLSENAPPYMVHYNTSLLFSEMATPPCLCSHRSYLNYEMTSLTITPFTL